VNHPVSSAGSLAGLFVENSPALPLIGLSLSLKTGSALDPVGKEGVARLTARLIRRTGAGRTAVETDLLLDSMGASLGAEAACSTIGLHGGAISRVSERFIDALADVVTRPSFRADEFELLVREAEGELVESLDNDRTLARRWFRRKLFEGHPYGRPPGGTIASLRRITPADIEALYKQVFTRKNIILGLAGEVDEATGQNWAERLTAGLPEGTTPVDDIPEPKGPQGRHLVIVDKPERTQTQIMIGGLGTHPEDPDHTALHVGNTIFGGTFTARLCQEVRAKRGWSYGATSSISFDRRRHSFSLWTFPKAEDAAPCIELQLGMLTTLRDGGVTKKELAWAKKYLERSHAFAIDTASKRVSLKVDSELYGLPDGYYEKYTERVKAVTLDEVNAAVRARLSEENLVISVVCTEKDIGGALRNAIPNLAGVEVIPFDRND
jgi:zinc protease